MNDPIRPDKSYIEACPFCGGPALGIDHPPHKHLFVKMPDHPGSYTIECVKCSAGIIAPTKAECMTMWNRRAAPSSAKPVDLREAWIHAYTSLSCDRASAERMVDAEIANYWSARPTTAESLAASSEREPTLDWYRSVAEHCPDMDGSEDMVGVVRAVHKAMLIAEKRYPSSAIPEPVGAPLGLTEKESSFLYAIMHNIGDTTDDDSVRRDADAIKAKVTKARALIDSATEAKS